ncbi:MAG: carbohydrate kinase family protein [Muribaculaceae bacterium]
MRKVIAIGELALDIIYKDNLPIESFTAGRIVNAATSIANTGISTTFVSECGNDKVGDIIINHLKNHNVITTSIDRFTDNNTSLSLIFNDDKGTTRLAYGSYPADRFDVVWPRIDEDDIVLFGSFYSIDPLLRERLFEMITYAAERKAMIIYMPGFHQKADYRITRVMTAILENLEVSNLVLAKSEDIDKLFKTTDATQVFHQNIEYYCTNYLHINENYDLSLFSNNCTKTYNNQSNNSVNKLGWHAGFCAGIIYGLLLKDVTYTTLKNIDEQAWNDIVKCGYSFANDSSMQQDNCISNKFGLYCATNLEKAISDKQQE